MDLVKITQENLELYHKFKSTKTIKVDFEDVKIIESPIKNNTNVFFLNMKTDEAAIYCIHNISKNVAALNFANRDDVGGGFLHGVKAQEEDLCRVSTLYSTLGTMKYPWDSTSILISPNIKIFRDSNYKLLKNHYDINVISAAAPNLNKENFDEKKVYNTLINIYISTKKYLPNVDTLILGAWGCGEYRNDPYHIGRIMNQVNLRFGGLYKNVIFAIPTGKNINEFKSVITLKGVRPQTNNYNYLIIIVIVLLFLYFYFKK